MPEGFLFCLCKNKDFFSILSPFLKKVINEKATIPHPLRLIRGGLISSDIAPRPLNQRISQASRKVAHAVYPCLHLAYTLPKGIRMR